MEILNSRVLLRSPRSDRAQAFYRDALGLAVYREFGPPEHRGIVFFTGQGLLEVSGAAGGDSSTGGPSTTCLWWQVRDVQAELRRLRELNIDIVREPRLEAWGLIEMWIADPDGVRIVLVEVPADHPLRLDQR